MKWSPLSVCAYKGERMTINTRIKTTTTAEPFAEYRRMFGNLSNPQHFVIIPDKVGVVGGQRD